MKKSGLYLMSGIGLAVILAVGMGVYAYGAANAQETETVYKETTAKKGNLTVGVTESGSITIGSLTQDMDFEEASTTTASGTATSSTGTTSAGGSETSTGATSTSTSSVSLEVAEVYVTVGQKVNEGDALLKLTDESIEKYRKKLTESVTEASADLSEANLSAAKEKLSAGYSRELSVASGSVAEDQYNATVAELKKAVDDAQEAVDESSSLMRYYQEEIDAGVDLSESLAAEQENYNTLYNKLKSAQSEYTTKSIEAKKEYQEALLSYQNANSQYSADVSGVDIDASNASDTLEDAKEALADFEAFVGDGVIHSEYSGTVMEVGYEAGDDLNSSTSVVTFADATSVTMTVSVSEEDITDIAIGDAVNVELTAYEDKIFDGVVESIDTSVSSGSSTVSYNVNVSLTGETDGIYTDMTGNVTFIQKEVKDVLYVSNKAIINEGTASYVKVKNSDGTIAKTQVTTGFSDGINVEIQSGLKEGDTVLIESQVAIE